MKKLLLSLALFAGALTAGAEGSGWYFVYDGNSWATDESTEFKTTNKTDVFVLENYAVTANAEKGGLNYQVTNKDWTVMYGWCAEADGHDVVGSAYKLGHVGNAWINCESGTYNITFNHADETILFENANSGIEKIVATDEQAEYYNLAGMKVEPSKLTTGIYIKRQGKKVSKVIIE